MRSHWRALGALVALALVALAAGCGGGSSSSGSSGGGSVAPSEDKTPVTLTLWHPWTGDEKKIFEAQLDKFHEQYPWITFKAVGYPDSNTFDDQVIKVRSQRAKWFGPGDGSINIATDLGYRELDIMGLATAQLASLSTVESQILEGYVAGYNGYLAKVGAAGVPGWERIVADTRFRIARRSPL